MRGLLSSVKKTDYIRYTIRVLEASRKDMAEQTQKLGQPINQQCCIFDLDNFSLKHVTWKPGEAALLCSVVCFFIDCVVHTPSFF